MSNKTTLKDALQLIDNYRCNNSYLLENKIITALAEDNAKLREALKEFSALPIVANGRIIPENPEWNNLIVKARETLTATDPEKRTI